MQPATRLAQLVEDRIGMQAVLSSQRIETLLDARQPLLLHREPGLDRRKPPDETAELHKQRGDQRKRNAAVDGPVQIRGIAFFRERHDQLWSSLLSSYRSAAGGRARP